MLHILENEWFNSLIGFVILVIITMINVILSKRKTLPVIIFDQLGFGLITYILFGWQCIIYATVCLILVIIKKRFDMNSEGAALNYNDGIFSFSRLFNSGSIKREKDEIVAGRILPVNHKELPVNMKAIKLNDTILSGATLITGSTGSGKTTTMKAMLKQAVVNGKPVCFFDFKGETDILDDLQDFCEKCGVPFYEFSSRNCTFNYDPLVNLNETGRVEALLNTRRWDASGADEHYKTSMQLAIQNLVHRYDAYRKQNNDNSNYIVGLYKFAASYRPEQNERDGFNNLIKQLEIILSSRAKDLFGDQFKKFSFETNEQFVICFSFISANKALANSLSSFIFQDIMDRGTRKHYDPKLLLCIDEFGTLENSTVIKDILEKGRSGGCQTIFSILDINQIAMNAGEYFVNAILGTINSFIIHAGATQKTAELLAGVQRLSNKDYDIMSLRKPINGQSPTALFISKYPLLSKKGVQEVYRIIPYNYQYKGINKAKQNQEPEEAVVLKQPENSQQLSQVKLNGEFVDTKNQNQYIDIQYTQPNIQQEQNQQNELTDDYNNIDEPTVIHNVEDFL